jgi:hypothetical protein
MMNRFDIKIKSNQMIRDKIKENKKLKENKK